MKLNNKATKEQSLFDGARQSLPQRFTIQAARKDFINPASHKRVMECGGKRSATPLSQSKTLCCPCSPWLNFRQRLVAIPLHRLRHRRLERVQFRRVAPADVVMLL